MSKKIEKNKPCYISQIDLNRVLQYLKTHTTRLMQNTFNMSVMELKVHCAMVLITRTTEIFNLQLKAYYGYKSAVCVLFSLAFQ